MGQPERKKKKRGKKERKLSHEKMKLKALLGLLIEQRTKQILVES